MKRNHNSLQDSYIRSFFGSTTARNSSLNPPTTSTTKVKPNEESEKDDINPDLLKKWESIYTDMQGRKLLINDFFKKEIK